MGSAEWLPEHMRADAVDLLGGGDGGGDWEVAAQHALIFRHAWLAIFGVSPSKRVHEMYCARVHGGVPKVPRVDAEKFLSFLSSVVRLPNIRGVMPSVTPVAWPVA